MAKKKARKKFTHSHEAHHAGVEGWLSRETHKMLAEFGVLVLAAVTADHLLAALVRSFTHA